MELVLLKKYFSSEGAKYNSRGCSPRYKIHQPLALQVRNTAAAFLR